MIQHNSQLPKKKEPPLSTKKKMIYYLQEKICPIQNPTLQLHF